MIYVEKPSSLHPPALSDPGEVAYPPRKRAGNAPMARRAEHMASGGAGAAADGGGGSFESALAALREANGGLVPSDVWRGGVLPFLANSDVLRLSGACRSLLPVAAAGLRSLVLRVPEGGSVEQLASLLQWAPHTLIRHGVV